MDRHQITGKITFEFETGTDPDENPEFIRLEDIVVVIGEKTRIEFSLADLQGVIMRKIPADDIMAILAEQKEGERMEAEESAVGDWWDRFRVTR